MKAICIEQNGQKVLVARLDDAKANGTPNGGAEKIDLTNPDFPATTQEVRQYIDANPMKNLQLHKVVDGAIVLRSIAELEASEFINWDYGFTPVIEEE